MSKTTSYLINNNSEKSYICSNCSRKYKNITNYKKHKLMCDVMCKTFKERAIENEDIDNTPSTRQLYYIILNLSNKCEIMEKKIEKLSAVYNKEKKKINVLEWLNNHKFCLDYENNNKEKQIHIFSEWIKSINITEEDMNYVGEHNFLDGLKYILNRILNNNDDCMIYSPIKAFEQKDNLFYVYDYIDDINNENKDKQNIEKKWIVMSSEKINHLFSKITKGLITQLRLWKDKNIHRISEDVFTQKYANNVKKITGGELSIQQQQVKFRKYLYNIVKINIKNIIEYEYDF